MSCNCFNLRLNAAGYPFTYATNYGGQIQFNTMPEYVSADMAFRIQNNWLNQNNMFSGCSGFMPGYPMYTPTVPVAPAQVYPGTGIQQGGYDMSTVQGYMDGRKTRISTISGNSYRNLDAIKTQLQELVNDNSITDEQKQEINKFLVKINQVQNELQKAFQSAQMANNPQILDAINNQVEALAGIAQELQTLTAEMLQVLIAEAEQTEEEQATDPSQQTDPSQETPSDEAQGDVQVIAPQDGNPDDSLITTTHKPVSAQVISITERIFDAVDGPATKDTQLKEAVADINKDNVLDVFDNWNSGYAAGYINDDKNGLIETIYDDKSLWYNGGKEEVSHIVNALVEKAAELGDEVLQAITPLKAKINSELNAFWNTDEDVVAENVNKIVLILNAYTAGQTDNKKSEKAA